MSLLSADCADVSLATLAVCCIPVSPKAKEPHLVSPSTSSSACTTPGSSIPARTLFFPFPLAYPFPVPNPLPLTVPGPKPIRAPSAASSSSSSFQAPLPSAVSCSTSTCGPRTALRPTPAPPAAAPPLGCIGNGHGSTGSTHLPPPPAPYSAMDPAVNACVLCPHVRTLPGEADTPYGESPPELASRAQTWRMEAGRRRNNGTEGIPAQEDYQHTASRRNLQHKATDNMVEVKLGEIGLRPNLAMHTHSATGFALVAQELRYWLVVVTLDSLKNNLQRTLTQDEGRVNFRHAMTASAKSWLTMTPTRGNFDYSPWDLGRRVGVYVKDEAELASVSYPNLVSSSAKAEGPAKAFWGASCTARKCSLLQIAATDFALNAHFQFPGLELEKNCPAWTGIILFSTPKVEALRGQRHITLLPRWYPTPGHGLVAPRQPESEAVTRRPAPSLRVPTSV
ncbi:hypothetical protein K438DRAFT_1784601 [Mycena galopus ATCC 62051]|nr:hypothetical protein K438DRAFT_1784601 [Mycena galopus ATCC 62051]